MQPSLCALSTALLVLPGLLSGCKISVSKALLVPKLANYQVYSYPCRLVNQFTPLPLNDTNPRLLFLASCRWTQVRRDCEVLKARAEPMSYCLCQCL